jgi:tRNA nucleotidyltransferase (CCA-adding enzyme)
MMTLPGSAARCMAMLEASGFAAYAVGGCVRDALSGRMPHDFDLCTSATPEQMKALFRDFSLVLAGEKHGTVGVVCNGDVVEITTFRTEGAYRDNRHPESVAFVTDIEQDLSRRDFTVNAMAWSPTRGLADPFGGQEDLKNGILRAVGDPETRFREDSLRILRGVRFATRFDLTPEQDTSEAMERLSPLMENLARERVFDELCKLLPTVNAAHLLRFAPILCQVIPELVPTIGFHQHTVHHIYDVFTHTAHVVENVPASLPLRWAALLHDIGKPACFTLDEQGCGHFYGHAKVSAQLADAALLRLKAPTALRQQVRLLIEQHMAPLAPDKKLLRRRLAQYGTEAVYALLELQQADIAGTGVTEGALDLRQIPALLEDILRENACLSLKDLAVNGHDLMALGIIGPDIGKTLNALLAQVLEEILPNKKEALLQAARQIHTGGIL